MLKEVLVPDIGAYSNVPVIEVLVSVGDVIEVDTALITLETDKAAMEVPAPFAGTVREVKVKVGDKVSQGSLILIVDKCVHNLRDKFGDCLWINCGKIQLHAKIGC